MFCISTEVVRGLNSIYVIMTKEQIVSTNKTIDSVSLEVSKYHTENEPDQSEMIRINEIISCFHLLYSSIQHCKEFCL